LAVYLLLRPDTTTGAKSSGESPFARTAAAPAVASAATPSAPQPPAAEAPKLPVAAPAPAAPAAVPAAAAAPAAPAAVAAPAAAPESNRPSASFAVQPRVVVANEKPAPAPAAEPVDASDDEPAAPAPVKKPRASRPAAEAPRRPKKPKAPAGPLWNFEGVVFDLLTARGVFAAKLAFMDADGNLVGEAETGPGGRYKAELPVGPTSGYTLKILHSDYTSRYIDEGDATSSLREATAEERQILMQAAARNLPWVGNPSKTLRRDLALVPKSPEEP